MNVLGINLGHDAGAALVKDGKIIAMACEERFLRIKHARTWPVNALTFCLKQGGLRVEDIDVIAVNANKAEMPNVEAFFSLERHPRARHTFEHLSPNGNTPPVLGLLMRIARRLIAEIYPISTLKLPVYIEPFRIKEGAEIVWVDHHLGHAASAYYTSGFNEPSLIITADGIGDGTSTAIWMGEGGKIRPVLRIGSEGSLGWAYGAVTEALGWEVNEGEGKTMGLAPYGNDQNCKGALDFLFPQYSKGNLLRPHEFGKVSGWYVASFDRWHFPDAKRVQELTTRVGKEHIAAEAQSQLERQMAEIILPWAQKQGIKKVCAAGGVFLNVKMNQRILQSGVLEGYHIYPDAGDGGIAPGIALYAWYAKTGSTHINSLANVYFGPEYTNDEIERVLKERNLSYTLCKDMEARVADLLAQGKIVGWLQGRMEAGPRALGNRSILMDPRRAENKDIINSRVKFREPFRPFCPSLLSEVQEEYLVNPVEAPYMIISFDAQKDKAPLIPAVVHVDGTARPQALSKRQNERFWELLHAFGERTGVPVLLNTSFNIRGEPIICTPRDAIKCFFDTGMDYLAMGDFLIGKAS